MKKFQMLLVALIGMFVGSTLHAAMADDPMKVAPDMYKLVFENDRVRVMEVTFQPGQKIPKHSHPDHYIYVAEGGSIKINKPDGTTADANFTVGQVVWISAETHWAQNTGTSVVRLVVNELKEPRAKKK